jgi:hypothetical protein
MRPINREETVPHMRGHRNWEVKAVAAGSAS